MNRPVTYISVITVCRNCAAMLAETAASVAAARRGGSVEYIVVDGASTDGTAEMLADGSVQADRYVSEPDGGIFDAMNKGARMASGKWLIYMNAGDTFASPEVLERFIPILENSDSDVVYGDALLNRGDSLVPKAGLEPANRHRMYFHHQAAFIRRTLQLEFPYRTDVGLSGDFCFFKEAWLAGKKFKHVSEDVCIYDCTGVSSRNRLRVIRGNIGVIRRFDQFADKLRFLPRLYFVIFWSRIRGRR